MADININKFRTSVVREGSRPASAGFVESEGQDPVDPAGSTQNHLPVTIAPAATALSITDSQVLGGAGTVAQYVRGDGSLADFPQSIGSGASVSYYLNGSVNQGTIGGVTYYEMNKTPIIGAGTDFTRNSNGYIASFLTDANDPSLLVIPAGNWNFETYFQASSGGGSPTFYLELYKYDGTTFTLVASNSGTPKLINDGTSIEAYFSALAVPQTTLTLTDRLAIRIYVTTANRTITLHTENGHLCQVITTFTTGLSALNGLTSQVQFFAVGTSGTNFNIASASDTHTFNLPTASATNRGALASADWTTFNNKQNQLNGTGFVKASGTTITYDNSTYQVTSEKGQPNGYASLDGNGKVPLAQINDALIGNVNYQGLWNAATNNPTLANPPSSGTKGYYYIVSTAGTFASISFEVGDWIISNGSAWQKVDNTDAVSSVFGRTGNVIAANGDYNTSQVTENTNLYYTEARVSANTDVSANTAARHNAVTLGTANGLSLSTQQLSLQLATSGQNGALSSTDWTTFNNKENAITAGTTAQYFRGDKTFQTLNTSVVPELTNLYYTEARVSANTDVAANTAARHAAVTLGTANGLSLSTQQLSLGLASAGVTGALSGTDWSTFNSKQQALNGTGFVKISGTTISYDNSTYYLASNPSAFIALTALSGTAPIQYNNTTGAISITQASGSTNGFLSSTDWTAFNSKQQALNGTGFVKISGTTISYDNSTYYLASNPSAFISGNQTITLSGDATGSGATAITVVLANSGVTAGTYNDSATQVRPFTVDAKGRITSIGTAVTITPDWANISGQRTLTRDDAGLQGNAGARSGFFETVSPVNYYSGANSWQHLIESRHTNDSNNYAMQIAGSFFDQEFYVRKTNNSATTAWSRVWHSGNITPVTGTGTTNYLPKFTGTSTIGNSIINESGTEINVAGNVSVRGDWNTTYPVYQMIDTRVGGAGWNIENGRTLGNLSFYRGGTLMTLDASGNLGLGVTPSAWNLYKAIQVQNASISNFDNSDNSIVGSNVFYGGSPNDFRYISTGTSTVYRLNNSVHSWFTAPLGTAGDAISFTQAMTLGSNSGLSIGTPSAAPAQGLLVQGNVGINNVSPAERLAVGGAIMSTGGITGHGANRTTLSQEGGSGAFWQSYGANTSNVGTFSLRQASSDFSITRTPLSIDSTGAATFSSSVTIGGNLTVNSGNNINVVTGDIHFQSNAGYGILSQNGSRLVSIQNGAFGVTGNVTIRPTSGYNAFFQTSGTALRINYLNDALSANISATYRATDFGWQDSVGNSILTLASTGAATFSSSVTANGGVTINRASLTASNPLTWTTSGTLDWFFGSSPLGNSTSDLSLYSYGTSSVVFHVAKSTGAATFSSSVTTGGNVLVPAGSGLAWSGGASRIMTPEDNVQGAKIATPGGFLVEASVFKFIGGNAGIGTLTPGVKFVNTGGNNASLPTFGSGTIGSDAILSANGFYGLYTGVASEGHVWQQVQRNDGSTAVYPLVLQPSGGNVGIATTTPNSRLQVNGSVSLPHTTKSANYTLTDTDYTVGFDCASNRTATLPDATTCAGRVYVIYQYNTATGGSTYVTLDGNGSQTIDGVTTYSLQYQEDFSSVMIQSTGSNWVVIAYKLYPSPL